MENKVNMVIFLWMGKTFWAKTPMNDFKVATPENPLLSQQTIICKGIPVPYTNLQLNLYPNIQLDLFCSDNLSFQCMAPSTWLTNRCTNPSTWLTPQQPFDCCSWFPAASHRNTNKIFNVGARDFAWLQNLKAYKKCNKNSFFCRRRIGFQKENLMNLSRVRFLFFHLP